VHVRWTTAIRRHPAAGYAVLVLGLIGTGGGYALVTGAATASAAPGPTPAMQAQIAYGRQLYVLNCQTCHGFDAIGKQGLAPSLIGTGAASVDFQVTTGRMPAREQQAEMPRTPPKLTDSQARAIAAFIESLGGGPQIPTVGQVSQVGANVGLGQQLFETNCAACHNFVGAGGALTYGKFAPPLTSTTPVQIYEAMLTGPEAMPVFGDGAITPQQKRDIIAFVVQTRTEPNPGGFSLGRVGPVTEGLVVFLGLMLFMVFAAMWIAAKRGRARE
jgi:ubiquinol-cytochrome c reductase cytochrome c subunit